MGLRRLIASSIAAIGVVTGLVGAVHAEPLRIAHTVWVGFGPLFIAQEKGFFAKEGVEVELIRIEEHTTQYAGLFSGQIDAAAAAFQDAPVFSDPDEPSLVCVLMLDESRGADGILATRDIQSIADLKGRSVAVLHGSVSHFYLSVLLTEAGLTQADLEIVDLSAEDAGEAFMMQEVDAAVTWEAWLTQGRTTDHGHLLTDSSERPGLIVDGLLTRADVFTARRDDFRAVARAWDAAVGYVETNPGEAIAIMARYVGGWLEDPAVFAETLEGVRFFDAESNQEYFRHVGAPGPDLPDRPIRDRPLVERRDAENAAVAGRHHRPRHLGRVGAAEATNMTLSKHLTGAVMVVMVSGGLAGQAKAEPLRVGYLTFVGLGPVFVAQDKGFFAKEGVEVELINMAIHEAMYAGLFAGQVDVIDATVDDMLPNYDPDQPFVCVMTLTESLGADGIVANNDIRSIADLKGKVVAFAERTVSQFYLNVLLRDAGLSQADIETVNMSGDDAGNAFLMQEVDAAVSWEPWLTQGKEAAHGHLLADTSERPGLVADCLVTRSDVLDRRLREFRALARAWDAALEYVEAHPPESNEIMARNVGGWLADPAVFAETLKGVRFYDSARNREYFGTPDHPGQIYQTSQYGIDVWTSLGALNVELTPADVIRHDLWSNR